MKLDVDLKCLLKDFQAFLMARQEAVEVEMLMEDSNYLRQRHHEALLRDYESIIEKFEGLFFEYLTKD